MIRGNMGALRDFADKEEDALITFRSEPSLMIKAETTTTGTEYCWRVLDEFLPFWVFTTCNVEQIIQLELEMKIVFLMIGRWNLSLLLKNG